MSTVGTAAVILSLVAVAAPALAGDPEYGAYLASECFACHPKGQPVGPMPPLHLLPRDYIVQALREYRAGTRDNLAMSLVARNLSDEDIESLADYFQVMSAQLGGR
ncbi:Cytochrome c-553 [bacterium HR40]|nr:Cytochrome c-553 [bacterium HR40]